MAISIQSLVQRTRLALGLVACLALSGCGDDKPPIESLPSGERPTNFVEGVVEIDPSLAGKVERGDVLYVILRQAPAATGQPGALVAAMEARSFRFPYKFVVTAESARSASLFKGPMELSALVSKRGSATARTGDLVGAFPGNPVEPGRRGLVVKINDVAKGDAAPDAAMAGDGADEHGHEHDHGHPAHDGLTETGRATVEGVVDVSPELAALVDPNAPLFIFLRSPSMPGPPLAMLKIDRPSFPVSFSLSKVNIIFDNLEFKPPMTLHARLSKSGSPVGQPGDLEGSFAGAAVSPGHGGYALQLSEVVQEKRASSMDNRPKESLE
jgi:hypothetical protein